VEETAQPRPARAPVVLQPVADPAAAAFPAPRVEPPRAELSRVDVPVPVTITPMVTPAALAPLRSTPSPGLLQLAQLLQSPKTAGTAFILREIFDKPLSKRRR
jgi:hypothetical protein